MRNPATLDKQLTSYKGALRRLHKKTDGSKVKLALATLRSEPAKQARQWFDTMIYKGNSRPRDYSPGQLLCFDIVALTVGLDTRAARTLVQRSPELRAEIGLQELTEEIAAALDDIGDGNEDVFEEGFPTRQLISNAPRRFYEYLAATNGDLTLGRMRDIAYVETLLDVTARHEIEWEKIVLDGQVCASPNKYKDRRRPDDGAADMAGNTHGRWKTTAGLVQFPFVLAGLVSDGPQGPSTMARRGLAPQLAHYLRMLQERAEARGLRETTFYEGALVTGDSAFRNNPCVKAFFEIGLKPAFRTADMLDREIIGYHETGKKGGDRIRLEQAGDGTVFCPCTTGIGMKMREPMRQAIHRHGANGRAYVHCERGSSCDHTSGVALLVRFGGPTHNLDGKKIPERNRSLVGIGPLWAGDGRLVAAIAKAENAIEHYHGESYRQSMMGTEEYVSERRRFWGQFRAVYWWTLHDLVWNVRLGISLDLLAEKGHEFPRLKWQTQLHKTIALWRNVSSRKRGIPDRPATARRRRRAEEPLHCPLWLPGVGWIIDTPLAVITGD